MPDDPRNAELEQVLINGPSAVAWCSLPDWQIFFYSKRFTQNFGYTYEDVPTLEAWYETAYPDPEYRQATRLKWRDFLEQYFLDGTPVPDVEVKIRAKDGSYHTVIITTALYPDRALVGFLEMTRVHQVESLLEDSEFRYRKLFENMTSAFTLQEIICDAQGIPVDFRYIEANPAFERMTGLTSHVALGHTIKELMPEFEDHWLQVFGKVALTGIPANYENYSVPLGKWFETYVFSPRRGQFAVVFNDITERIQARQEVQRLNAELEERIAQRTKELESSMMQLMESEKLAGLGALVAGIAHEVNTPLGTAFTAASYITEIVRVDTTMNTELAAKIREGMDMVSRNLDKASAIIRSFRQFSADQSSGMDRDFFLRDLVHDVITSLNPRLKQNPVEVRTSIPGDLQFSGPAGDLSQVLTNLVMNALIHGIDPSHPHITVEIRACMEGDDLVLEVGNDGVPIPPELRERIFEPFFTTKRSDGGTGLGLSIVNSIVSQRCQGSIRCESSDSCGAGFRMVFPTGPDLPLKNKSLGSG